MKKTADENLTECMITTPKNCCTENREIIKESSKKIQEIEINLKKLRDVNEEAINTVKTNCDMMKAITTQNDIILKNIQGRLDASVKFIYVCIGIVLFLLLAIGYGMLKMHVL